MSKCDKEDDLCTDHFEKSVKMSTYLVAFVVCDYKSIQSQTQKGIKVSVYYNTQSIEQYSVLQFNFILGFSVVFF